MFNPKTEVYYPVAVSDGSPLSTKALAKLISKRCTVTRADSTAVLTAMVEVINETLSNGRSVHLDGMGYLKTKLNSAGVASLANFSFKKQVKAVRVQLTPERVMNSNGAYERELIDSTEMEWSLDASSRYKPGDDTDGGSGTEASSESSTESSDEAEGDSSGDSSDEESDETETSTEGDTSVDE